MILCVNGLSVVLVELKSPSREETDASEGYENEELIAITKKLADTLRKNRTIDRQKRDSTRAKMRIMIKKLLKKHRYPPEGMDDAGQTVMMQCELWTDNNDMGSESNIVNFHNLVKHGNDVRVAAERLEEYGGR